MTSATQRREDHGPNWCKPACTARYPAAQDDAAWQAALTDLADMALMAAGDPGLVMFNEEHREPVDYAAISEYWLDVAAEAGDPVAIARQRELEDIREASRYVGLADLGLDPMPRLRRPGPLMDKRDPHDALDACDYVGIHMEAQSRPHYVQYED